MGAVRAKRRWHGELARPIRPRVIRPLGLCFVDPDTIAQANDEMIRLTNEAIAQKFVEKLDLLMKHYLIPDPHDWFSLALALAVDHVPGFQIENTLGVEQIDRGISLVEHVGRKKTGRPKTWSVDRLDELLNDVEKTKKQFGLMQDREALSRIARLRKWAPPANHRGERRQWIKTLESRLQEAKVYRRNVDKLLEILGNSLGGSSGNSPAI
jgi:hypothetical protein